MNRLAWLVVGGLMGCGALAPGSDGAQGSDGDRVSGIDQENFNKSISPGEDFFEHVNGKWLERTEIPPDRSDYGSFTVLVENSQKALRKIIEATAERENESGSDDQQVADFYKSYMNTERLEKLGTAPIHKYLETIDGVDSKQDLNRLLGELPRMGLRGAFGCFVNNDARKSDEYIVYVSQGGLSLPDRDYYLSDDEKYKKLRAALVTYVEKLLTIYGHERPAEVAERVLDLETRLAKVQWSRVENRNPLKSYNKMTSDEVNQLMPNFDWAVYSEAAGFGQQKTFIVRQPSFFEGFNELYGEVPIDVWKDYLTYRLMDAAGDLLTRELDELYFDFHQRTLRGVAEPSPRWKRGVEALNGVLGELVGKIYVREYFKPEAKERMGQLVKNLKKAFEYRIDKLEWMSPETKKLALAKLAKINTKIGYPDKWKDYTKLEIRPDDLLGNYLRAAAFENDRMINKLGKPIDRTEWGMTPQTVNAYYNPVMNEIVFPAAILQPPFFNMEADDAVNYGGIGAVIGHELSHGFDDSGSRFDGDGNLNNWWTPRDRTEFEMRGKELVAQYADFKPIGEMHVNGELTLGENIGDLGGVNVAYTAYQLSLAGKPAPEIDEMTGDQRFFLGYGQIWRRKYRDEELRRRLLTDPHSPARYRVLGIVSNIDAFYDAFGIKEGQPMYVAPEDRVRIW